MSANIFDILANYGFEEGKPPPHDADLNALAADLAEVHVHPRLIEHQGEVNAVVPSFRDLEGAFRTMGWYFDRLAVVEPCSAVVASDLSCETKVEKIQEALAWLLRMAYPIEHGHIAFLSPTIHGHDKEQLDTLARANLKDPDLRQFYMENISCVGKADVRLFPAPAKRREPEGPVREVKIECKVLQIFGKRHNDLNPLDILSLTGEPGWPLSASFGPTLIASRDLCDVSMEEVALNWCARLEQSAIVALSQSEVTGLPIATTDLSLNAQLAFRCHDKKLRKHSDYRSLQDLMLPVVGGVPPETVVELKQKNLSLLRMLRGDLQTVVDTIREIESDEDLEYELSRIRQKEIDPRLAELTERIREQTWSLRVKGWFEPLMIGACEFIGTYVFSSPFSLAPYGRAAMDAVDAWHPSSTEKAKLRRDPFFYLWLLTDARKP